MYDRKLHSTHGTMQLYQWHDMFLHHLIHNIHKGAFPCMAWKGCLVLSRVGLIKRKTIYSMRLTTVLVWMARNMASIASLSLTISSSSTDMTSPTLKVSNSDTLTFAKFIASLDCIIGMNDAPEGYRLSMMYCVWTCITVPTRRRTEKPPVKRHKVYTGTVVNCPNDWWAESSHL